MRERMKWAVACSGTGLGHQFLHFTNRLNESDHDRTGDNAVADVEFDDFGEFGQSFDVFIGQAMAGAYAEPEFVCEFCRMSNSVKLLVLFFGAFRVGVSSRVQFDIRRADFMSGLDLIQAGFNEQTRRNPAIPQQIDNFLDPFAVVGDIQATLRR